MVRKIEAWVANGGGVFLTEADALQSEQKGSMTAFFDTHLTFDALPATAAVQRKFLAVVIEVMMTSKDFPWPLLAVESKAAAPQGIKGP